VLSRRELWELRRKQAEERIRIPDKAVSADRAEEELEEELREKATRPGRSILPSAEGELKPVSPAEKDPLAEMLKEE